MKTRRIIVKLETGDVRSLRIIRGKGSFRIAVYDADAAVPLIQAKLSAPERQALRRALGQGK